MQGPSSGFTEWAKDILVARGFAPAAHHRLLLSHLDCVSRGETDRLMVLMPPGSAKSTYASVLFPAWWFTQHPSSSIIAASHTVELATHFGRQVRDLIAEHGTQLGYALAQGNRAASRWSISTRGEYFATGLRGPIAGRRADLVIIDDPVRSHAEADSLRQRDRAWDWFRADLLTRLKPKGRIVLIMTRWHQDDLGGRLLAGFKNEWNCLRLPAIAEAGDPLGRMPGAALWPEWEDAAALERKRASVGERAWSALFQQSPRPPGGAFFRVLHIQPVGFSEVLAGRSVRAWDLAASSERSGRDPDWTVGLKLLQEEAGRFVVVDVVRLRGSPHQVEQAIAATASADGHGVPIGLPQDPGQAGKSQVAYLARRLAGYRLAYSLETGSKAVRAAPVAAQIEAGNFAILQAGWNGTFLEELSEFPHGAKDDQVDALSRAFTMLVQGGSPTRRIHLPLLAR